MNNKLKTLSDWLALNGLRKESRLVYDLLFKRADSCKPPFNESLLDSIRSGGTLSINSKGPAVGYMQTMLEGHVFFSRLRFSFKFFSISARSLDTCKLSQEIKPDLNSEVCSFSIRAEIVCSRFFVSREWAGGIWLVAVTKSTINIEMQATAKNFWKKQFI